MSNECSWHGPEDKPREQHCQGVARAAAGGGSGPGRRRAPPNSPFIRIAGRAIEVMASPELNAEGGSSNTSMGSSASAAESLPILQLSCSEL